MTKYMVSLDFLTPKTYVNTPKSFYPFLWAVMDDFMTGGYLGRHLEFHPFCPWSRLSTQVFFTCLGCTRKSRVKMRGHLMAHGIPLSPRTITPFCVVGLLCVLFTCYRQHCAKRNAPVFNLLRGRFWGFSPRRGDTLHRRGEIWQWGGDRRSPPPCQISPPSVQRLGYRTPKLNFFYWDLIKMWNPCAIFIKFAEFVPRFRMR